MLPNQTCNKIKVSSIIDTLKCPLNPKKTIRAMWSIGWSLGILDVAYGAG